MVARPRMLRTRLVSQGCFRVATLVGHSVGAAEVCSATNGAKLGNECPTLSFSDAEAKCRCAGARLCSTDELEAGVFDVTADKCGSGNSRAGQKWWTKTECRKNSMPGHFFMNHKANASSAECQTSSDTQKGALVCCADNDINEPTQSKRNCALKKDEKCGSEAVGATTTASAELECQMWCEKQERGAACQFEVKSGTCAVVKDASDRKAMKGFSCGSCVAGAGSSSSSSSKEQGVSSSSGSSGKSSEKGSAQAAVGAAAKKVLKRRLI